MNLAISKIKKFATHRHPATNASSVSRAWLRIVYGGFALFALSIVFHVWFFFSAGKTMKDTSTTVPAVQTLDRAKLNSVLSDYIDRQEEEAAIVSTDSALKDPSQ